MTYPPADPTKPSNPAAVSRGGTMDAGPSRAQQHQVPALAHPPHGSLVRCRDHPVVGIGAVDVEEDGPTPAHLATHRGRHV